MKNENLVLRLPCGIYRVVWKDGTESVAAVGTKEDGVRWLAPTNWTEPSTDPLVWLDIKSVQRIE